MPSPIPSGSRATTATTRTFSELEDELSNESVTTFDTHLRRTKKFQQTEGWHEVTISTSFAIAVSSPSDEYVSRNIGDHRASAFDAPKAQNYYHIEFKLTPEDTEVVKTDVVYFGSGARVYNVYPERSEVKSVKTWTSANNVWVGWIQNIKLKVNNDCLVSLSDYQMIIRVWDSRDKCGLKAKFDRPKTLRFPAPHSDQDPDSIGGVKNHVQKLCTQYLNSAIGKVPGHRPFPIFEKPHPVVLLRRESREETKAESITIADHIIEPITEEETTQTAENYAVYSINLPEQKQQNQPFSRLADLAAPYGPESEIRDKLQKKISPPPKTPVPPVPLENKNTRITPSILEEVRPKLQSYIRSKRGKKEDPEQEHFNKFGRTSLVINMAHLFSRKSVIERLNEPVNELSDMLVSVNIEQSLLSPIQKEELNPLVIRIKNAKSMPSTPMSHDELQNVCELTYCQYEFFNKKKHRTSGRLQSNKIVWDDVQVLLTGLMDQQTLREYLSGAPLTIEVHDRDKRPVVNALKPALFGDHLEDEKICNIGLVTAKRTAHSAFGEKQKTRWDPYGVVKLGFQDLLKGTKLLTASISITPCTVPGILGFEKDQNGKLIGIAGAVDGPKDQPLPAGHYLTSGAVLNISLELFNNLISPPKSISTIPKPLSTKTCNFSRIIFIIKDSKYDFLVSLLQAAKNINASALSLESSPAHVVNTALHNFKFKANQISDPTFDILSGFHLTDGLINLVALEGMHNGGILSLWNNFGKDVERIDSVRILYNKDYSFSQRLYAELDTSIPPIRTHEPLKEIVKQPLLYVRDIVPKICFQGIIKLHQLSNCSSLQTAITNDMMPTVDMISAVSREFGIPHTVSENSIKEDSQSPNTQYHKAQGNIQKETKYVAVNRWMGKLDNFNESYFQALHARQNNQIDYVKENILDVERNSRKVRAQSCPVKKVVDPNAGAHNYSIQTLNSTVKSKNELKRQLNHNKRYTYSHRYLRSATLEPVDPEEVRLREKRESKLRWKFPQGWNYPSITTSQQANMHPKVPDEATKEALKERWIENQLHTGALQPTVPDRDNFPVDIYNQDFERYKTPPHTFGKEPPSIMAAGDTKAQEEINAAYVEHQQWQRRVVVNDTLFHTHRLCPATEMQISGLAAANQIDRLKGLRKESPMKYGLVDPGYHDLPALRVLEIDPDPPGTGYTVDSSDNADLRCHFIPRMEQYRGINPIYREKTSVSIKLIKPLNDNERQKSNLFNNTISTTRCA